MTTPIPGSVTGSLTPTPSMGFSQLLPSASLAAEFSSILPLIIQMLQNIRELQDELLLAKAATKINEKFQRCSKLLEELPGTELTRDQQEKKLLECLANLNKKCELLEKYKSLPVFEDQMSI